MMNELDNKTGLDADAKPVMNMLEYIDNLTSQDTNKSADKQDFFIMKSANSYMEESKMLPTQKQLFGKLFNEDEFCILFSDSNVGKSIMAVQIGEQIAGGQPTFLELTAEKQKVLYFDFELSIRQFAFRYTDEITKTTHKFPENLIRIELNPDAQDLRTFEKCMFESIEKAVIEQGAKVLIVDNISYLATEQENANAAAKLIITLNGLKKKYGLSILALAHTTKILPHLPIIKTQLAGSAKIYGLIDSCFAIGKSNKGLDIRYIKQLKTRNGQYDYESDNVIECRIDKVDSFLQFIFQGFTNESEHLKPKAGGDELTKQIIDLHKSDPTLSDREIGRRLGCDKNTVAKRLNN